MALRQRELGPEPVALMGLWGRWGDFAPARDHTRSGALVRGVAAHLDLLHVTDALPHCEAAAVCGPGGEVSGCAAQSGEQFRREDTPSLAVQAAQHAATVVFGRSIPGQRGTGYKGRS